MIKNQDALQGVTKLQRITGPRQVVSLSKEYDCANACSVWGPGHRKMVAICRAYAQTRAVAVTLLRLTVFRGDFWLNIVKTSNKEENPQIWNFREEISKILTLVKI